MPEGVKVATASAELRRRWSNSSDNLPREIMTEITKEYIGDLKGMGYMEEWVKNVLDGALKGYERLLEKVEREETHRHKLSGEADTQRRHRRLFLSSTWYKKRPKSEEQKRERVQNQRKERKNVRENRGEKETLNEMAKD